MKPCWCNGACPHVREAGELVKQNRPRDAEHALGRRLVDAPSCAAGQLMLARILSDDNRGEAALVHVHAGVDAGGWSVDAYRTEATRLRSLTLMGDAVRVLQSLVDAAPQDPNDWHALVDALDLAGDQARAASVIADAMRRFPDAVLFRRQLARVKAAQKDFAGAIATLAGDGLLPLDLLDRGRYRDRAGDHAGAWDDWSTAKARLRDQHRHAFMRDTFDRRLGALFEMSTPARLKLLPRSVARPIVTPLFVTGFARSGTTLTETIFGAHPRIFAGDELMYLIQAKDLLPRILNIGLEYPFCLGAAAHGEAIGAAETLTEFYVRKATRKIQMQGAQLEQLAYFTDKMPLNEMDLPFIRMLFPTAPVRHVIRHPLDVMVSNMSHMIAHGWWNAAALESCAYAYAQVDALVQHYRRVMPANEDFSIVRYDTVVAGGAGELVAHLPHAIAGTGAGELGSYHHAGRHARTISYADVKEPVYDRSVGRWKHYRAQLAPVLPILAPIIERENFEL